MVCDVYYWMWVGRGKVILFAELCDLLVLVGCWSCLEVKLCRVLIQKLYWSIGCALILYAFLFSYYLDQILCLAHSIYWLGFNHPRFVAWCLFHDWYWLRGCTEWVIMAWTLQVRCMIVRVSYKFFCTLHLIRCSLFVFQSQTGICVDAAVWIMVWVNICQGWSLLVD